MDLNYREMGALVFPNKKVSPWGYVWWYAALLVVQVIAANVCPACGQVKRLAVPN